MTSSSRAEPACGSSRWNGPKERDAFAFMAADVSSERPHHPMIADVATRMRMIRDNRQPARTDGETACNPDLGTKVLFVGGPAIIHAGGREALSWLIDAGFIHVLFCGTPWPRMTWKPACSARPWATACAPDAPSPMVMNITFAPSTASETPAASSTRWNPG